MPPRCASSSDTVREIEYQILHVNPLPPDRQLCAARAAANSKLGACLLDAFPQVKTVFLNSGGGHLRPALSIARTIRSRKLKTVVPG
jgi:hypothetical protein